MAIAALALFAAFLLLVGGVRPWIQWRRTGDIGDRRKVAPRTRLQRRIDVLAATGSLAVSVASPGAALAGLDPLLREPLVQIGGLVLAVLGAAATFAAQLAMGDSWRVGVDPAERTALITSGVFGLVRNPVITAVTIYCIGLTLMVPTAVAVAGLVAIVVAHELLVRLVEEPHLRRLHGDDYLRYAMAVGRSDPE